MSEFNATQFLATQIRTAADDLSEAADALPANRLDWRPTVEGKAAPSARELVLETASLMEWALRSFREHYPAALDESSLEPAREARRADATMWLVEAANNLSEAVAGLPVSILAQMIRNPITGTPASWAEFALSFQVLAQQAAGQVRAIHAYCAG